MGRLKIYFVRHGITSWNQKGLLCGRSDALLAQEGWEELFKLKENYQYPEVERVYCSPAIRCRETASVFYPEQEPVVIPGLWEVNFGDLEGKGAEVLSDPEYSEKWSKMDPALGFREGESLLEASFRVRAAMTRIVKECVEDSISTIALVAHGMILGQLIQYCLRTEEAPESFKLTPNGMGIIASIDTEGWYHEQIMEFEGFFPEGAPRPRFEDSPYFKKETDGE